MSSEKNDFQFELNETLYFEQGDEVLELISIALNPEISIHPNDTYVSIRGEVELSGEYILDASAVGEEEPLTFDDIGAKRYIQQVDYRANNIAEFTHRFPVDITVPDYRVENVDDIRIEITSFDYEFPTNTKLQLTAIAEIQGIKEEVELIRETEERKEEAELPSFSFEVRRSEVEVDTSNEETIEMEDEVQREEITNIKEEEVEESVNEDGAMENELIIRAMEEEEHNEDEESDSEVKDVSYLADIFQGGDEERYTKMKICIVQEDDTIESIAERFQISTLQLIKSNNLDEDFEINEGQLLYIPQK